MCVLYMCVFVKVQQKDTGDKNVSLLIMLQCTLSSQTSTVHHATLYALYVCVVMRIHWHVNVFY